MLIFFIIVLCIIMCKQETTPSKPYYTESYTEEDKVVEESSDGIRLAQEADVWVGGEHHDKYVEEQSDDIVTDDEEDGEEARDGDGLMIMGCVCGASREDRCASLNKIETSAACREK